MKKIVLWLIHLYQKTLSPDHGVPSVLFPGGYCKFTPTCSMYMHQGVEKYGIFKGVLKGLWRILRCNPWNKGGEDLP